MAKFLVTRTVVQEVIVEGVSDRKTAAARADELLSIKRNTPPYSTLKVIDEMLISTDVDAIDGGSDLSARVKQLASGASEDRFTQLSDHKLD